jgi:uncharacterized protein
MQLVRVRDGAVVAADLRVAGTFTTQLLGLMFRAGLRSGEGLWLHSCNAIHMMFMRFSIDVLFLRSEPRPQPGTEGELLKVCSNVRPWIGMAWCMGASTTVELAAGTASRMGLRAGDLLCVRENTP